MEGLNMERRVRRLEAAFCPPWRDQLRTMATQVAQQHGLDPELVLNEAMVVLRQIGERQLSVHDPASAESYSPDDLARMTQDLRSLWGRVA
jgi:hypothetical protein